MSNFCISGFAPVARNDARVLILGSMPGKPSLKAQQYYANPGNAFWKIMGVLFDAGRDKVYEQRLLILQDYKIALWDVLKSCTRESSLDRDIKSEVAHDFPLFLQRHPHITHVFFNGTKAESAYRRQVKYCLDHLVLKLLPSTSGANTRHDFAGKLKAWSEIKAVL